MTTLTGDVFAPRTAELSTETETVFTRIFALVSAAGKAIPFHRESTWLPAGSTNVTDRDSQRAAAEIRAITSMREHG